MKIPSGELRVELFSDRVIRVVYRRENSSEPHKSFSVIGKPVSTRWRTSETVDELLVDTDRLEVRVNRQNGAVNFYNRAGRPLLLENPDGGKSLTPARVDGVDTLASRAEFVLDPEEAFYGLGQHQQGYMNYQGKRVQLRQENREVAVPMMISSRGYGLLWDNPAVTEVDFGSGAQASSPKMTWSSEAAGDIEYYFMYGPDLDQVIAEYRQLTGAASMFGKWAWGFWQCRERYQSQKELLEVVDRYRQMHVPLDGIIQDWQYWTPNPWGSHEFDTNRYPQPAELMRELHTNHVHALISVWAKFDVDSANANELRNAGGLYSEVIPYVYPPGKGQWYDAFNPEARKIYWRQIARALFAKGFDGWWLDASEPELSGKWGEFRSFKTAAGSGAGVFNAYPLLHTTGVYEGQREDSSHKRVFILTRSAYAGQQRNAAVTWSGDIRGTWGVFARQIPAGLNFMASGIPYWNTDIGGFFGGDPADPKYAELFTRWFQFGAFCPMFRVHGTGKPKEMWRFDSKTENILIAYDQLRYHLLPYIYSVSWKVTSDGYTMMRPLVMDFRDDTKTRDIADQFMFGSALMVNPVTQAGATNRAVYLPTGTHWTDFWTGDSYAGGTNIQTAAPIERMPLFVRAGSIIPCGPSIEYAMQSSDPVELRVYRGADGAFTLYEDEGDNYNYEQGAFATIPMTWSEKKQTLIIGKRRGSFSGMLEKRTFRIVWVSPGHGGGAALTARGDSTVTYTGSEMTIRTRR